jgi:acetyltransferase-like isoleucine patch superfamily enzyme
MSTLLFHGYMAAVNALLRLPGHALRRVVMRHVAGVALGRDVTVERGVALTTKGGISIGDRTIIGGGSVLDGRGGLTMGRDVNVSPGVRLLTAEHDIAAADFAGVLRGVVVGDRSWLATGAIVLPGTTVGEGAVVGAGAVARGAVEPWSVMAGNPAIRVGDRPRAAQQRLQPYRRFLH